MDDDEKEFKISVEEKLLKKWFKEAMKEWLDKQKQDTYQSIGQWITQTISVMFIVAAVYLILWANGFKRVN